MPPRFPDRDYPWSAELAYTVGLITTDGSLSKDGRHVAFRSSDIEQINNFKKCLKLSNKVGIPKISGYSKKVCYRLQFGDVQLYRWLLKVGLFPAKTYSIGRLEVPDEFFRDFLRGHLDGDGSIVSYLDEYNVFKNPDYKYVRLVVRFVSASQVHMRWIQANLMRLLGVKGDLCELFQKTRPSHVNIWQLKFMKRESMKLLGWIYYSPNIPCLNRKRLKAKQVLKVIAKIKRKPYVRLN